MNKNTSVIAIFLIVFFIITAVLVLKNDNGIDDDFQYPIREYTKVLEINGQQILVDVADDNQSRIRGLSGQKELLNNQGLLFIFDKESKYGIWMKDMLFSIDIIWLSSLKEVVSYKENISPETFPEVFYPTSPAKYVLELPAGSVENHSINVGDKAVFLFE